MNRKVNFYLMLWVEFTGISILFLCQLESQEFSDYSWCSSSFINHNSIKCNGNWNAKVLCSFCSPHQNPQWESQGIYFLLLFILSSFFWFNAKSSHVQHQNPAFFFWLNHSFCWHFFKVYFEYWNEENKMKFLCFK